MKTKFLIVFLLSYTCMFAQAPSSYFGDAGVPQGFNDAIFAQASVIDLSPIYRDLEKQRQFYSEDQWKNLIQKKYLTIGYSPCFVDDYKTLGYLKYNIADDQMEFLKNDQTLYLRKELGKKIRFTNLKSTYKVYELDGKLEYFLVQKEAKNSLLVKQVVKFIKPKEKKTGYDGYKPANFLRVKDKYYLALDNKKLVQIPRKKKKFHAIFGDKSSNVQAYMKENKLGYKSLSDLEKVIEYYNTL